MRDSHLPRPVVVESRVDLLAALGFGRKLNRAATRLPADIRRSVRRQRTQEGDGGAAVVSAVKTVQAA